MVGLWLHRQWLVNWCNFESHSCFLSFKTLICLVLLCNFINNFGFIWIKACVIIRGLPQNTTEDALQNYFENTRRSGGGHVEEVNIKGDWARIKFESAEGTLYVVLACAADVSFPFSMRGD